MILEIILSYLWHENVGVLLEVFHKYDCSEIMIQHSLIIELHLYLEFRQQVE